MRLIISNILHIMLTFDENYVMPMNSILSSTSLSSTGSYGSSGNSSNGFLSKYSMELPIAIASLADTNHMTPLDASYQPGPFDVVCGRGKGSYNRPGNKRFRSLVATYIPQYLSAKSKVDKSVVLNTIIDKVHSFSNPDSGTPAQFVKYTKGTGWVMIGDDHAREKVGHAIREAIAAKDGSRSSSPSPTKDIEKENEAKTKQYDLLSQIIINSN